MVVYITQYPYIDLSTSTVSLVKLELATQALKISIRGLEQLEREHRQRALDSLIFLFPDFFLKLCHFFLILCEGV